MIAVIDYGMGNLRSVQKALEVVGAKTKVTSDPKDLKSCEKIVFPGVGSFGEAMRELKRLRLVDPICDAIEAGKPFLGLCLGLQLLFEKSEESPGVKGLCVLEGESKRFRSTPPTRQGAGQARAQGTRAQILKVPHMGWNGIKKEHKSTRDKSTSILKNVPDNSYMYFVHSYYVVPKDKNVILTTTGYGIDFVSGIAKDNIYAFQFHPEKSQEVGLRILKNFVRL